MRTRNIHINLRLTPEEKVRLKRNAGKCGLSVSEFLRQRANDYEPQPAPTKEFFDLTRLLSDIYDDFRISGEEMYAKLIADTLMKLQSTINPVKSNGNN